MRSAAIASGQIGGHTFFRCGQTQPNPTVLAVDFDHTGTHGITHIHYVLHSLNPVTAQLRDMDESINAVLKLHEGPKGGDLGDHTLDQVAHGVQPVDVGPRIVQKLLEPERNPSLIGVDVQNDRLDLVALLQDLTRMVDLAGPRHVRNVDHAVQIFLDLHERAVRSHVADFAADFAALRERLGQYLPRVRHRLTQPQRDLACVLLDIKHDRLDLVAHSKDVTGFRDALGPGHLRHVDQPLHAFLELDEAAVWHDVHHPPLDPRVDRVLHVDRLPRVPLFLLQPQRHALTFAIHVQHHDFELFPHLHYLARMRDAAPRHVGNVQEPIHPLEVDESTEVRDILHHASAKLARRELGQQLGPLRRPLFLEQFATGNDDVAAIRVYLEDLELGLLAQKIFEVPHGPDVQLRARQEGVHAHVDDESALHPMLDQPLDGVALAVVLYDVVPGLLQLSPLDADQRHAVLVLDQLQEHVHVLPDLDQRPVRELIAGHKALGLVPDVDQHTAVALLHDDPRDHGALGERLARALIQQVFHRGHVVEIDEGVH